MARPDCVNAENARHAKSNVSASEFSLVDPAFECDAETITGCLKACRSSVQFCQMNCLTQGSLFYMTLHMGLGMVLTLADSLDPHHRGGVAARNAER